MNKQELIEKINEIAIDTPFPDAKIADHSEVIKLIERLDEPQKPAVPQFVADYIKYAIENDWDFQDLFKCIEDEEDEELLRWVCHERNQETLAAAWINGYTAEKEPKYTVKIKGKIEENLLVYGLGINRYFFARTYDSSKRNEHTRKELEEAGFGWVFDCPGIEIEEVE